MPMPKSNGGMGMPEGLIGREEVPSLCCVSRHHGCHGSLKSRGVPVEIMERIGMIIIIIINESVGICVKSYKCEWLYMCENCVCVS
jgi:hypothetical protein